MKARITALVVVSVGQADFDRLAQIVGNLVTNASRYSQATIAVGCRAAGGWLVVTVVDDGPGIAAEDLPHVFDRLYQAKEQPVRAEVGGGLGLAIVHGLVEAMGGTVKVSSSPDRGATFEFRIPLMATSCSR